MGMASGRSRCENLQTGLINWRKTCRKTISIWPTSFVTASFYVRLCYNISGAPHGRWLKICRCLIPPFERGIIPIAAQFQAHCLKMARCSWATSLYHISRQNCERNLHGAPLIELNPLKTADSQIKKESFYFRIILTLILISIGPLLFIKGMTNIVLTWNHHFTTPVQATVMWARASNGGFRYRYTFNNQNFTSERYAIDERHSSRAYHDWQTGDQITAYIDPNRPERAVINRSASKQSIFFALTGILLTILLTPKSIQELKKINKKRQRAFKHSSDISKKS